MKYVIKHQSNSRVRLELPFTCPHPVQMYLEELACTVPGIEKLHFYGMDTYENGEVWKGCFPINLREKTFYEFTRFCGDINFYGDGRS